MTAAQLLLWLRSIQCSAVTNNNKKKCFLHSALIMSYSCKWKSSQWLQCHVKGSSRFLKLLYFDWAQVKSLHLEKHGVLKQETVRLFTSTFIPIRGMQPTRAPSLLQLHTQMQGCESWVGAGSRCEPWTHPWWITWNSVTLCQPTARIGYLLHWHHQAPQTIAELRLTFHGSDWFLWELLQSCKSCYDRTAISSHKDKSFI